MAAIASAFFTEEFTNQLDDLLFEVCEDLQLSPYRYIQANDRYKAVATVLEADGSPCSWLSSSSNGGEICITKEATWRPFPSC